MDVFAIKKGKAYALNIDNFEDLTKKDFHTINIVVTRN